MKSNQEKGFGFIFISITEQDKTRSRFIASNMPWVSLDSGFHAFTDKNIFNNYIPLRIYLISMILLLVKRETFRNSIFNSIDQLIAHTSPNNQSLYQFVEPRYSRAGKQKVSGFHVFSDEIVFNNYTPLHIYLICTLLLLVKRETLGH